jgi:hypothetical protein
MASNQKWDDKRTPSYTRKVHRLEEVDMLTTMIDLLIEKLENPSLDHLKMIDARVTCEECGKTGHISVNCPMVCQDAYFFLSLQQWFSSELGFKLWVEQA